MAKKRTRAVYRVEDDDGLSPHMDDDLQGASFQNDSKNRPGPQDDFPNLSSRDLYLSKKNYVFGFSKAGDADRWFGKKAMRRLKKRGYKVKKIAAKSVIPSRSGRQVMFVPEKRRRTMLEIIRRKQRRNDPRVLTGRRLRRRRRQPSAAARKFFQSLKRRR